MGFLRWLASAVLLYNISMNFCLRITKVAKQKHKEPA
jgi:hypothetical protein